jgi:hypothetical protein
MLTPIIASGHVADSFAAGGAGGISPRAPGFDSPFLGSLSRAPSGAMSVPDPRESRREAQETLEHARRIAQSRELPSGWAPPAPADLTGKAEAELRSGSEEKQPMHAEQTVETESGSRLGRERTQGRSEADAVRPPSGADPGSATGRVQPSEIGKEAGMEDSKGHGSAAPSSQAGAAARRVEGRASPALPRLQGVSQVVPVSRTGLGGSTTPGVLAGHTAGMQRAVGQRSGVLHAQHPPSREAVASQVVRGFALALRQAGGKITLRLSPEHLGQVVVSVVSRDGKITARIEPSEASAHRLLVSSADGLRAALEARGLSVERVEVVLPPPEASGFVQVRAEARAGEDRRRQPHRAEESLASVMPEGAPVWLPVSVTLGAENVHLVDATV